MTWCRRCGGPIRSGACENCGPVRRTPADDAAELAPLLATAVSGAGAVDGSLASVRALVDGVLVDEDEGRELHFVFAERPSQLVVLEGDAVVLRAELPARVAVVLVGWLEASAAVPLSERPGLEVERNARGFVLRRRAGAGGGVREP